jgi:DNA-binding transcriptional MerR regulator
MSSYAPIDCGGLLTRREVADIFRVTTHTIRMWELRDLIPTIRQNARVIRYRRSDVEKLIEEGSDG